MSKRDHVNREESAPTVKDPATSPPIHCDKMVCLLQEQPKERAKKRAVRPVWRVLVFTEFTLSCSRLSETAGEGECAPALYAPHTSRTIPCDKMVCQLPEESNEPARKRAVRPVSATTACIAPARRRSCPGLRCYSARQVSRLPVVAKVCLQCVFLSVNGSELAHHVTHWCDFVSC